MNASALCLLAACLLPGTDAASESAARLDEYAPCGHVSLFLICSLKDVPVEWPEIQALVGPPTDGQHSFGVLAEAARKLGLHPVGLQVRRDQLAQLPLPAIVHLRSAYGTPNPHLAVLVHCTPEGVQVLDPPYPVLFDRWEDFEQSWTGNVLVFPATAEEAARLQARFARWHVWRALFWCLTGLGAVLILCWGLVTIGWFRRPGQGRTGPGQPPATGTPSLTSRPAGSTRRALATAIPRLLVLGGVVGVFFFVASPRRPHLVLESMHYRLGELAPGERTIHIPLLNAGRAPLVVEDVRTTCTCAVVAKPADVAPGATVEVPVTLYITPGPGGAQLLFRSNDRAGPRTVKLEWHGAAKPLLVPQEINCSAAPLGQPYVRSLRVAFPGGRSALVPTLKSFQCDEPCVEVVAGRADPEAFRVTSAGTPEDVVGELELIVRITPPSSGPFVVKRLCKLVLQYGKVEHVLDLPMHVAFVGGVIPDTEAVLFTGRSAQDLKGQKRRLGLTLTDPAAQVRVEGCPPWLRCQPGEAAGNSGSLELELVDAPPSPCTRDTIYVCTGGKAGPRVPVQIRTLSYEAVDQGQERAPR